MYPTSSPLSKDRNAKRGIQTRSIISTDTLTRLVRGHLHDPRAVGADIARESTTSTLSKGCTLV